MTENTPPITQDKGFALTDPRQPMQLPASIVRRINRLQNNAVMMTNRLAKRRAKNKVARRSRQINRLGK